MITSSKQSRGAFAFVCGLHHTGAISKLRAHSVAFYMFILFRLSQVFDRAAHAPSSVKEHLTDNVELRFHFFFSRQHYMHYVLGLI